MNATAPTTLKAQPQYLVIVAKDQQFPVELRRAPTQAELTQVAAERVVTVGLSGVAGTGAGVMSGALGTLAVTYGQPLVSNLATLDFSNPVTALTTAAVVATGGLATYLGINSIRHLWTGAKMAIGLARQDLLPDGKGHPEVKPKTSLSVAPLALGTEVLAAATTGSVGAALFSLANPYYALAAGAAFAVATAFTGRQAIRNAVAWATRSMSNEHALRLEAATKPALEQKLITQADLDTAQFYEVVPALAAPETVPSTKPDTSSV